MKRSGLRRLPHPRARRARDHCLEQPQDYGEHFKPKYRPTIVALANAEKDGREGELDAALSAFCDEWNLGTPERVRFEQEYPVVVGTRR